MASCLDPSNINREGYTLWYGSCPLLWVLFTSSIHQYCSQVLFINTVYSLFINIVHEHCSHLNFSVQIACSVRSFKLLWVFLFPASIAFEEGLCVDISLPSLSLERDFALMFPCWYRFWRGKCNSKGCFVFWCFIWVSLSKCVLIWLKVAGCQLLRVSFWLLYRISSKGELKLMLQLKGEFYEVILI